MCSDDEVLVRSHGVEACPRANELAIDGGNALFQPCDDVSDIILMNCPIDGISGALGLAAVNRDLAAARRAIDRREPVGCEAACRMLRDNYLEVMRHERLNAASWLNPGGELASYAQRE